MSRTALLVFAAAGLVLGWWTFSFLCDDAYILFRYVSNSQLGHGYVWNAPPFAPVEGYSSLLWVILLDWTWTLTGLEPPEVANLYGLGFGFVQLGAIVALVDGLALASLRTQRTRFLGIVLLATLTNRTFLAWLSGGLETSLFDALVLWWLVAGLRRWVPATVGLAALLALARPDGLLFCAASVPFALLANRPRALALLALPLAHEAWRLSFYGAWLPNTYYAKVAGWWPEMGLAYAASFILEYGFWVLLPAAIPLAAHLWRNRPDLMVPEVWTNGVIVGTLIAHMAYYTLRIGGDHFEYRVYAWIVPLVWIAAVRIADTLDLKPAIATLWLTAAFAAGLPLPWTHWAWTHDLEIRHQRGMPKHAVAPHMPWFAQPIAQPFDALQRHTIGHFVGMRHQTHRIYLRYQQSRFHTREEGLAIGGTFDVMRHTSVGWPGWVLPHVSIIDEYGLNDAVIARNPRPRRKKRLMAHERMPPEGYIACFRPNIRFDKHGALRIGHRDFGPEDVARCEALGWAAIQP